MEKIRFRFKKRHVYHALCFISYSILIPNLLKLFRSDISRGSLEQMERLVKVYVLGATNLGLFFLGVVALFVIRKMDKAIIALIIINLLSFIFITSSFLSFRIF